MTEGRQERFPEVSAMFCFLIDHTPVCSLKTTGGSQFHLHATLELSWLNQHFNFGPVSEAFPQQATTASWAFILCKLAEGLSILI